MGGHALSVVTIRLLAERYRSVASQLIADLDSVYPGQRKAIIPAYADKPDFGDIDILISDEYGYTPQAAATALGACELVRNGSVSSLGLALPEGVFQVDLISVPPASFDFALRYFAMNDLGNLLGRVAHKAGFKLGHLGLRYMLRDREKTEHVIAELEVSTDWQAVLDLFGYDAQAYERGLVGDFRTLEDIFHYAISSRYCHRDIYLLENRNARARMRDRKRKTYMLFLDWLEALPDGSEHAYDWSDKEANRQTFLAQVLTRFPAFAESYRHTMDEWQEEQAFRRRFNGQLVAEISTLQGVALGRLMRSIAQSFPDGASLRRWVRAASDEEIVAMVKQNQAQLPAELDAP